MKSGMISIVGRPNVGKSTLLNKIINKKIAITSDKVGTTRNIILGVYNDKDCQMVFVDTPGIHKPVHKLGKVLNDKAYLMTTDIDVILFIVDIAKGFGKGDRFVLDRIKDAKTKIILILNKVDQIKKDELIKRIDEIQKEFLFDEIIPLSAKTGINVDDLINTLKKYLPHDMKYYDDNFITNQPKSLIITERVREKILELTHDEIPHTVTCVLDEMDDNDELLTAGVTIVVDRENLKKMIIGKQGKLLKEIGTRARMDLEEYFEKKVFLSLYVKVIKNWRDRESLLHELGLKDDLNE